MRGLYAIVDVASLERRGLDARPFTEAVASAQPAAIQLRDKRNHSGSMLTLLRALAPIAARQRVLLLANDRADLAMLAGCGGVHVGQDDLPPSAIRSMLDGGDAGVDGSLTVGMSVHDDPELDRALAERPDYIALGPVYPTPSKHQPAPTLGLDGLRRLAERARRTHPGPLVAIGGLDVDNVAEVAAICDACAVIGALLPASASSDPYADVAARAARLQQACS